MRQMLGVQVNKRALYLTGTVVVLVLLVSGGAAWVTRQNDSQSTSGDEIQRTIRSMTIEEKVGQMFVLQVFGQSVNDRDPANVKANQKLYGVETIQAVMDKYKPGGIAYFAGPSSGGIPNNVDNPRQLAGLSNGIQKAAMEQPASIPALIGTDQEQGWVVRVPEPATQFPGNMALGATRNPDYAKNAARVTGEELRAMGINQDFAPVADVNVDPENPVIGIRSFGSRADLVGRMVAAQVTGYQENVVATAKHFPGHGNTDTDSHTGLPIIHQSKEEVEKVDLPPFESAIASRVDVIMTAHIVVPALDNSGRPATLAKPILTGVLREELGYDGVVITDALNMGALQKFGQDKVPVETIKAGADMLLMPPDMDAAYKAVLDAVKSGEISEERIDESVRRILQLKQERGLFTDPYVNEESVYEVVGTPQHRDVAKAITDKTITLVKNDDDTLPLQENSGEKALVTGYGATIYELNAVDALARDISEYGLSADAFETGYEPSDAKISEAVARAEATDLVIVTTGWASGVEQQQRLVKSLLKTGKPVVVVAVGDPYDLAYFPEAETYLATYDFRAVSMEALARVLFGEVNPSGNLPVSIPAANDPKNILYPYGYGLSYKRTP